VARLVLPLVLAACAARAAAVPVAAAAAPPEPEGVLELSASATVQVPNDWITVEFGATRDGSDANAVQAALKQALGAALELARREARPDGQVEVEGGGFSLQPRFDAKGRVDGWSGSTSMRVQGRDMAAIAALAGRVTTMTVSRLDYGVSREAREKVEGEVAALAIARFRAQARDYAKAFGYGGYVVRDVNVQTQGEGPVPPRPLAMARLAVSASVAPLPTAAGTGSVTANVNGSVQMK
jgi:predicted secreted protein